MAAQALHRSQSYLGHFYRRMRAKLGAPKAITATAHKTSPHHLSHVTTRQDYDETICVQTRYETGMSGSQAPETGPAAWFQLVAAS